MRSGCQITTAPHVLSFSGSNSCSGKKRQILQDEYDIPVTEIQEEEMLQVCNLSEGVWYLGRAEGMEKGMTDGIFSPLKNLIETLNLTIEQSMAALKSRWTSAGSIWTCRNSSYNQSAADNFCPRRFSVCPGSAGNMPGRPNAGEHRRPL